MAEPALYSTENPTTFIYSDTFSTSDFRLLQLTPDIDGLLKQGVSYVTLR